MHPDPIVARKRQTRILDPTEYHNMTQWENAAQNLLSLGPVVLFAILGGWVGVLLVPSEKGAFLFGAFVGAGMGLIVGSIGYRLYHEHLCKKYKVSHLAWPL